MAIYREDIVDIELESGTVYRSFMNHQITEGDIKANRFGFRVLRGGIPVDISGCTAMGYFIRANGSTVVINGGNCSGNEAYVTLPSACYAVEGNFSLALKLVTSSVTSTMRIIDGTVVDSTLGSLVDPGSTIPSVATLENLINLAEAAAAEINSISITAGVIEGTRYRLTAEQSSS